MIGELITLSGWIAFIALILYFFLFLEKAQRGGSILLKAISHLFTFARKKSAKWDIVSRINNYRAKFGEIPGNLFQHGVKLDWCNKDSDIKEGDIILRVPWEEEHLEKTFCRVVLSYIPMEVLHGYHDLMDTYQKDAITYSFAKEIILSEGDDTTYDIFMDSFLSPIKDDFTFSQIFDRIDRIRRWANYPLLIEEIRRLRNQYNIFHDASDYIYELLDFVYKLTTEERKLDFDSEYGKISAVLVANPEKSYLAHVEALRYRFEYGADRVYLLGYGGNIEKCKAAKKHIEKHMKNMFDKCYDALILLPRDKEGEANYMYYALFIR
jgi:hypothetical protein